MASLEWDSLSQLLNAVKPTSDAKFVALIGTIDTAEMPDRPHIIIPGPTQKV